MGLHTLHRETNVGLNQQCYKDVLLDTIITLYMRNRVHGAIVKCWLEVLESWTAGDRHQNYACPDALTASPPSSSFPRSVCGWWSSCSSSTWHRRHHWTVTVALCHKTLV